jgi:AraC family transcriptional regulator
MDVDHHESQAREFPLNETHGIALWPKNQLLVDSRGLGWRDAYTSLAIEQPWRRRLPAVPHICLAYCQHGAAKVSRGIEGEGDNATSELRSRLFGVVPENRNSNWDLRGRPNIQLVYLRRAMVDRLAAEAFDLDASRVAVVPKLGFSDPLLEQLVLELLDCAGAGGDALYADHLARMIESALGEDLRLERLAREAGVSAHAFSQAFARAFGTTPHAYIRDRRIERAKSLLLAHDLPLAEVALHCGFASQSHLTTTFKRLVGRTPGAFRRG